jgi:hypothetical protein
VTKARTEPALEVTLGPAPCSECHAQLWFVAGKWQELHYRRVGTDGDAVVHAKGPGGIGGRDLLLLPLPRIIRTYQDHVCTARQGNPVVHVTPKGKQGRGGHWRNMVGLTRKRRAPKGRPELI